MITKRMKSILRYRTKAMIYLTTCSNYDWDDATDCIKASNNYLHWNSELLFKVGSFFPFLMTFNLLMKLFDDEFINTKSFIIYGVYIMGWVENCLIIAVLTITYRFNLFRSTSIYVLNEIFRYSQQIEGKIVKH